MHERVSESSLGLKELPGDLVTHHFGAVDVRHVRVVLVLEHAPVQHDPVVFLFPFDVHHEVLLGFEGHPERNVGHLKSDITTHGRCLDSEQRLRKLGPISRCLGLAYGLGVAFAPGQVCIRFLGAILLGCLVCTSPRLFSLKEALSILFVIQLVLLEKLLLNLLLGHA